MNCDYDELRKVIEEEKEEAEEVLEDVGSLLGLISYTLPVSRM